MADVTIWHNPRCSKSRQASEILQERGIEADVVRYLDQAPSRAELERVLGLLGTDDPTAIARRSEDRWKELACFNASVIGFLPTIIFFFD